jgi:hypothetical protein
MLCFGGEGVSFFFQLIRCVFFILEVILLYVGKIQRFMNAHDAQTTTKMKTMIYSKREDDITVADTRECVKIEIFPDNYTKLTMSVDSITGELGI